MTFPSNGSGTGDEGPKEPVFHDHHVSPPPNRDVPPIPPSPSIIPNRAPVSADPYSQLPAQRVPRKLDAHANGDAKSQRSGSSSIPKSPSTTAIYGLQPYQGYLSEYGASRSLRSSSQTRPSSSKSPPASPQNQYRRPSLPAASEHSSDRGQTSPSRRYSISAAADIFRAPSAANLSSQRPFFHRLISSKLTVTNPTSQFDLYHHPNSSHLNMDTSSLFSEDVEEQQRRLAVINSLRPQRLIGDYKALAHWMESYRNDLKSVKNKRVRQYYENQNYLIERFTEIDNFLDAGKMHYNMLSTYGNTYDNKNLESSNTHNDGNETDATLEEEPRNNSTNRKNNENIAPFSSGPNENTPLNEDLETPHYESLLLETGEPSQNTVNSKYSRFHGLPGNINEGARFLGYDEQRDSQQVLVAILVNFFVNFVLLVGKIIVAVLTNSMSMVASLVDSVLDFLSTFIIFFANRLSTTPTNGSEHSYPVGRSRLEPLGVLVFSIIIILSFFQVGQESFKKLFLNPNHEVVTIGLNAIIIMTFTIVSKVCCWLWCANSKSSSVQALAQDAQTDIVFNIVSLLMPTIGHIFDIWFLDPLGALLLSIYVIASWSMTAYEHIDNLTGAVADPLDYKVILYLAYRFAESIKQITALKVYHVGDNVNVEIDVIFNYEDLNLTLKDCHDIAEALQYSIESLPMVERAFVHIEYMEGNFRGHLQ